MVTKCRCAFLRDGYCPFIRAKCKWEHDDAPCPNAVRRVVHMHSNQIKSQKIVDPHLETAAGRYSKHTCAAYGGIVYWSCKRKSRYRTENDATRAARKMEVRYGKKMFSYYCKYCSGYHLTKKPRKEFDAS